MCLFKKRIPRVPELTKSAALQLLKSNGYLSAALIQQEFAVGYAIAAEMIDALAEEGDIKRDGKEG